MIFFQSYAIVYGFVYVCMLLNRTEAIAYKQMVAANSTTTWMWNR